MDFIGIGVWVFDTLVLFALPLISILMAFIFIYKITQAAQTTTVKWFAKQFGKMKSKLRW